jgi:hypothetical protein
MTAAPAITTAAATTSGRLVIVPAIISATTLGSEKRKQAAHIFAATFHANNPVSMLVADQQFKLRFAICTIILV